MRDDIVGLDAALIMNPKVWQASGHLQNFTDPLVECKVCHIRAREDKLADLEKSDHEHEWSAPQMFNLMFKTHIGPTEDKGSEAYLRPETAQAMFVDFKNVLDSTRIKIPFGIAQIGKAFRNEITPGNFIFRTREFEQMEIEYFIKSEDWEKFFEHWRGEMTSWMVELGIDLEKITEREVPQDERAHYSQRTIDFDYAFPFGQDELYGLAYRGDFDLKNHQLSYKDQETGEEYVPHVIEPTWGVDRSILVVLLDAYREESGRVYLAIKPSLAPYKVAVFPLLANKPELVEKARKIYEDLRKEWMCSWDDRGNIGKRYASQDEIGTPYCITVDFDILEDESVTVRDRDSAKQDRVKISELKNYLMEKING